MKTKRLWLVSLLVTTLTFAPISSAWTQATPDDNVDELQGNLFFTSSTSTTTLAIAGGVILTVMLVSGGSSSAMHLYLEQNAVAVQHDLHLGGGETARDLAGIFQVEERHMDAFASLLFESRDDLTSLAQPGEIDALAAHKFTEVIVQKMLRDQALASTARQLLS